MRKLCTMLLLLLSFQAMAQSTVTGTIKDGNGEALPGATVTIKGTTAGSVADIDGKYSIKVPNGDAILVYSFVGFESKEVKVGTQSVIDVVLAQGMVLEEVVTIGYGSIRSKKSRKPKSAKFRGKIKGYNYSPSPEPIKNTESYDIINENKFLGTEKNALSTLSIDVDAASYSNMRRFITNGEMPPKDAVRIEEMVNYFNYDYPQPKNQHPFSINTEVASCPWNDKHKLVHIGLQGLEVDKRNLPASNLVFLVDVSGSMNSSNKLGLLKSAFKLLVDQLRPDDRVAIVVYAGAAGVVLPSTSGKEKGKILAALDNLRAGGSTAGGAGIKLAYKIALENLKEDGNNRIILATDGDFNVGASSDSDMVKLIEEKRKSGIFLTCLGFGMGNYQDSKMEKLADKGNGNYAYIDTEKEAKKVLVEEFGGTLFTIAKDVKIQLEFNPAKVRAYRLIGYENRLLADEDFADDTKDAGELGSGHTVTALYEIIPVGVEDKFTKKLPKLKYSELKPSESAKTDELFTVKFRYKKPDGKKSILLETVTNDSDTQWEKASDNFRFSASVAAFGMLLRESEFKGDLSYKTVLELAKKSKGKDSEGYRTEFIELVKQVSEIP